MRGSAVEASFASMGIPLYIGRYHIKRIIGHGGMGAVYEAMQEQPRRVVALKVMRTGAASRSALRRFLYESQLLARLKHPGIAQVYEAGTHVENGVRVPYFAMEYIAGARSLTEFAEQRDLSTDQRVELFMKVCDAVHHGHQKGIVHRDLKPLNILVDSEGRPKIIDFGVARATDSDMAVTTQQTDVGSLIGTLQYMSPEQVAADPHDIDTRSDVYAMGIILFELVCRTLPYDCTKCSVPEAIRVVREQSPARPSAVSAFVKRDLEVIILKAMEKDRDRRYRSAADLADDLKRYLTAEPVSARPASIAHQLKLFTKRNRTVVVAAGVVFAALMAATLVSAALAFKAGRDNAKLKRFTQFTSVALGAGEEAETKDGAGGLSLEQAAGLVSTTFSDSPVAEARVRLTLARAHADRKQWGPSAEQAALALAAVTRPGSGDAAERVRVEAAGALAFAQINNGRSDEAAAVLEPFLRDWKLLGNDQLGQTIGLLDLMVLARATKEDWQAARSAAAERLEAGLRLHGNRRSLLVRPLHNLSLIEGRAGQLREARDHFDQAEQISASNRLARVDDYRGPRDAATAWLWPENASIGAPAARVISELNVEVPADYSPPAYEMESVARAVREALRAGPRAGGSVEGGGGYLDTLHSEIARAWLGFEAQALRQRQVVTPATFRAYLRTNPAWTDLRSDLDRVGRGLDALESLSLSRASRWAAQRQLLEKTCPPDPAGSGRKMFTYYEFDECVRGIDNTAVAYRAAWKVAIVQEVQTQAALDTARTLAQRAFEQGQGRVDYQILVGVVQFRLGMRARSLALPGQAQNYFREAAGTLSGSLAKLRERPKDRAFGGEELAIIYLASAHLAGSDLSGTRARRDSGLVLLGQAAAALHTSLDDVEPMSLTLAQIESCDITPPVTAAEFERSAARYAFQEARALSKNSGVAPSTTPLLEE